MVQLLSASSVVPPRHVSSFQPLCLSLGTGAAWKKKKKRRHQRWGISASAVPKPEPEEQNFRHVQRPAWVGSRFFFFCPKVSRVAQISGHKWTKNHKVYDQLDPNAPETETLSSAQTSHCTFILILLPLPSAALPPRSLIHSFSHRSLRADFPPPPPSLSLSRLPILPRPPAPHPTPPQFISPALFPFLSNSSFRAHVFSLSTCSHFSSWLIFSFSPCLLVYRCRLLYSIIPSVNEQINLIALSFSASRHPSSLPL